ncbi:MAG TPA: hypothetical protein ENI39_00325 [Anaerolineae bacterium]|nr:hypothetical protein [Anaerolineae bacterium]
MTWRPPVLCSAAERDKGAGARPPCLGRSFKATSPRPPAAPGQLNRRFRQCEQNRFRICLFGIFHIITSNRPPEEWPALFGDLLLASAGLDRLTHGAQVVVITGASYRAQGPRPEGEEVGIEPSNSV